MLIIISRVGRVTLFFISDTSSYSSSKTHHLFCKTESSSRLEAILNFISYIWEDYCIEKLEDNKWKCFWCVITFQGINATKSLAYALVTRDMHTKSCNTSIDKSHLSRYKDIHKYRYSKKNIINDHLHKLNY